MGLSSGVAVYLAIAIIAITSLFAFIVKRRKASETPSSKGSLAEAVAPEEEPKEKVTLLFGTQTGTAERFAKQLRSELQQKYGDTTHFDVIDIEDYAHEDRLQKEKVVFLLLATYGDGEPTDNAATFFKWVLEASQEAKEDSSRRILQGVNFAIFGLGNKQYEHFCAVGRKVQAAMLGLGANAIAENGVGDDDEDIEADFEKWKESLLEILHTNDYIQKPSDPKETNVVEVTVASSVPAFDVQIHENGDSENPQWQGQGTTVHSPFPATVLMHKELHSPESERSCLHVELDLAGSQASYQAGDHIGILPENECTVVEQAAECLGLPLDIVFSLHLPLGNPHQLSLPFTGPISLRNALTYYTDLVGPLSKTSVQVFAAFAHGEDAKRLTHLLSPAGQQDYKKWHSQSRSLLELLQEFKSVKPTLGALYASIAYKLQTRFYSISSSPNVQPNQVHVTCALVQHETATGRQLRGVASHHLKRVYAGDKVPVFIRQSSFRLPKDPQAPVIMIGPGTGLAPFRGFLQERAYLAAKGVKLGPAHLFFGCRNSKHDYIYQSELEDLKAQGGYTKLHTAFSREGPKKVYVQHRLEEHEVELWHLIENGGYVYVCGEAKNMAKDVHRVLLRFAGRSQLGSEAFMQELTASGRYQKDVW